MTQSSKIEIADQVVYFKSSESMEETASESVTLVITSPPYWNVRDYGGEQIGFGQSYKDYIKSLDKVWMECIRVLQPNGKIAINVQPLPVESSQSGYGRRIIQNIMHDIESFMRKNGLYLSGMHYWDKTEYVSNVSWGSYPKPTNIASNTGFEQIFVWVKPGKTRKVPKPTLEESLLTKSEWRHWAVRCIWDDISPVLKIDSKGQNRFGHSAPFPESIPYRLIRMHSAIGETVLDPFLGSGTTLKVCRITGRKGIGYEINTKYTDLIRNRILENWRPPPIDSQYKVFGTSYFFRILEFLTHLLKENPSLAFKQDLLKDLHRNFPEKMTRSWINHLDKLLVTTHSKTSGKNVLLDEFFQVS